MPEPSDLATYVKNKEAAILLGKALFWDMQVGSDGIQACASCHFKAGADSRTKNVTNPGMQRVHADGSPNPDSTFDIPPNDTVTAADFPLRKLSNPDDRNSAVVHDTNDVVGSPGVTNQEFVYAFPGMQQDFTNTVPDTLGFNVDGVNTRQVEPRNTPTVINAVFNHRQFWDGRAQFEFNGVNHLGARDPNAKVFKANSLTNVVATQILIEKSSLASQAVAPPLSILEMSGAGRRFPDLARRLLLARPLAKQLVHPNDSVLGDESRHPNKGLHKHYFQLVKDAFQDKWWKGVKLIRVAENGTPTVVTFPDGDPDTKEYTLMEYNFSLFFGLAVQLYEATLVADDTPYDRFQEGDTSAMSPQAVTGMFLFMNQTRGRCINCHIGSEFTGASVSKFTVNQIRRREGNIIDFGWNNIGVRPTTEDIGLGANDPFGVPLSVTKLATLGLFNDPTLVPPIGPADRLGVDGAFKVPGIRNVELTAPFFHNGGQRTLREVVEFYGRGGDFQPIMSLENKLISPVNTLNFDEEEKQAFVAFLLAMTDERVRNEQAPFDHPQIFVPNGHPGDASSVTDDGDGAATDDLLEISAVGASGGPPQPDFLP